MARPPAPPGTRTYDRGWIRIKLPDHPLAIAGWVREHRAVLYDHIGPGDHRCYRCEVTVRWSSNLEVEHLDRNPANNSIDNLAAACRQCQNANRVIPSRQERRNAP